MKYFEYIPSEKEEDEVSEKEEAVNPRREDFTDEF